MKTNTIAISLIVASLFFTLHCLSYADAERKEKIVASVTKVVHPKNAIADTVTLWMTIHAPSRFGGFTFMVVTESRDRARIRADFPAGSLQTLELPAKTIMELEAQIDAEISVQKTLDTGIDPMKISQAYVVPSVKIGELPTRPVAFTVSTEQSEQPGAGQPATKPADKVPAEVQPSTPTSKDIPR
jgi:hypothetical protein